MSEELLVILRYGPYVGLHGILRHRTQWLCGLTNALDKRGYKYQLQPTALLHRLEIEIAARIVFSCNQRFLKFNNPSIDNDPVAKRALTAIEEHLELFSKGNRISDQKESDSWVLPNPKEEIMNIHPSRERTLQQTEPKVIHSIDAKQEDLDAIAKEMSNIDNMEYIDTICTNTICSRKCYQKHKIIGSCKPLSKVERMREYLKTVEDKKVQGMTKINKNIKDCCDESKSEMCKLLERLRQLRNEVNIAEDEEIHSQKFEETQPSLFQGYDEDSSFDELASSLATPSKARDEGTDLKNTNKYKAPKKSFLNMAFYKYTDDQPLLRSSECMMSVKKPTWTINTNIPPRPVMRSHVQLAKYRWMPVTNMSDMFHHL